MTKEKQDELVRIALSMRQKAYTPYSHFTVGAALMTKAGKIYTGCNIENSSYTPTVCAERTAFFKAVSEGEREFSCIAVVGGPEGKPANELCAPCGVCRQVMMEFCDKDFIIILGNETGNYTLETLDGILPYGFKLSEQM